MKKRFAYGLLLLGVLTASVIGAAPEGARGLPKPPPPKEEFKLPPSSAIALSVEQMYVADFDTEYVVRDHPTGYVKITKEAGPITIRAKFADGTGANEKRTYTGKFVYTVEALPNAKARIDLEFIPVGLKADGAGILDATIDVNGGEAPRPPPDPDPKPKPIPVISKVAWIVVVEESTARTAEIVKVLGDKTYWDRLKAGGINWVFYDKDSPDLKMYNYDKMIVGVKLPACILMDKAGHDPLIGLEPAGQALPLTTAAIDTLLVKYGK